MKFFLVTRNENGTFVGQYHPNEINGKVTELMRDGYVENVVAFRGASYMASTPKKSFKIIHGITTNVSVIAVEVGQHDEE